MKTSDTSVSSRHPVQGERRVSDEFLLGSRLCFDHVSIAEAMQRGVAPLVLDDGSRLFVVADSSDALLMAWLAAKLQGSFQWAESSRDAIGLALGKEMPAASGQTKPGSHVIKAGAARTGERTSPVVEFVDRIISEAWEAGASDIHWECGRDGLSIRYRLDGVLVEAGCWTGSEPEGEVLSRIKVLAELDIAERRVPQDGRFTRTLGDRSVDFRVSVMPNSFGEDAVIRILDKRHLLKDATAIRLDQLGFEGDKLASIRELSRLPHGMLLVTGPTGSGKTTTLYAAISETLSGREKVVTIEDPIEYELGGVLQIPVNEKKGLTFARGLRSILRHDPDTIFVGEIRDPETADIAVQSALTGHLVFTTVHANDLLDVIGRFVHMKIDLFSLMSALNGVVSQRLVRILCKDCAMPVDREPEARKHWAAQSLPDGFRFLRAVGCERCRNTGFSGRTVLSEVVPMDDRLRDMVINRRSLMELKARASGESPLSMQHDARSLLAHGLTSLEEIDRVLARP